MKKILLIIIAVVCSITSLGFAVNTAIAQTESAKIRDVEELVKEKQQASQQDYNPQNLDLGTNSDVPTNLSTYTQSVFIEITSAASCLLTGFDPVRPDSACLGFDPETKKIGYIDNNGGALGLMSGMIASTYDIPASSSDYIKYMAGNFGITQKASAVIVGSDPCEDNPALCGVDANGDSVPKESSDLSFGTGTGFDGLQPLLGVWTAMRNIVYLMFVLFFIIIGLGIMFRLQVDPRAVMSIQSQLPKIIIALILVTFSYAIAGFLIDMMYLSLFLIISVFQGQNLAVATSLDTNPINAAGGLGNGGISGIAYDAASGVSSAMTSLFDGTIGQFVKGLINTVFGTLLGAAALAPTGVGAILGGVIGGILGGAVGYIPGVGEPFTIVVGAIAWVIIAIALLSALFRLWFTLIKTYVFILINITFAPIWIAFGLIPGSSLTFGNWIRALVSDLLAFPLVLVLFSLGKTLQQGFSEADPTTAFVPPYIGNPGEMSVFSSIIGMGIILLAPEAVNIAKSALKAPEFKYTSAIGRSLGVGQGVMGAGLGGIKKSVWYTNPHTGEPGRLKAFAGQKAMEKMDKIPVIGKKLTSLRDKFSTPEQIEDRFEKSKKREAIRMTQKERATRSQTPPAPQAGDPDFNEGTTTS